MPDENGKPDHLDVDAGASLDLRPRAITHLRIPEEQAALRVRDPPCQGAGQQAPAQKGQDEGDPRDQHLAAPEIGELQWRRTDPQHQGEEG